MCITSLRGSILETTPRASMHYLIYLKLGNLISYIWQPTLLISRPLTITSPTCPPNVVTMLLEIAWLIFGVVWLKEFYLSCPTEEAKEIMFGK